MTIFLMFLLGGLGRSLVGTGRGPRWIGRWSVYPPIALLSAYIGLAPAHLGIELLVLVWVALIASLSMGLGYTQWESWKHMSLRLGLPALGIVLPLAILLGLAGTHLLYVSLSVMCGLLYPHRQGVFVLLRLDRAPHYSWLDSSRLAEFITGACVLGGLSLFGL